MLEIILAVLYFGLCFLCLCGIVFNYCMDVKKGLRRFETVDVLLMAIFSIIPLINIIAALAPVIYIIDDKITDYLTKDK